MTKKIEISEALQAYLVHLVGADLNDGFNDYVKGCVDDNPHVEIEGLVEDIEKFLALTE